MREKGDNMQVVNTGNTYKIYDNSLRTFNQLPAQAYLVNFDKFFVILPKLIQFPLQQNV